MHSAATPSPPRPGTAAKRMADHGAPPPARGIRNTGEQAMLVTPEHACGVYIGFAGRRRRRFVAGVSFTFQMSSARGRTTSMGDDFDP